MVGDKVPTFDCFFLAPVISPLFFHFKTGNWGLIFLSSASV